MATISHKNLPNAQLHECKGASTAAAGQSLVANGSGSAVFRHNRPRGAIAFVDLSTPYSLTYPASLTKASPTTSALSTGVETTEGSNARLTYVGLGTSQGKVVANVCLSQSTGADRDIELAIYKNGVVVANSNVIATVVSGKKTNITCMIDTTTFTNDYFEVYVKNHGASGDISIYTFFMNFDANKN